MPRLRRLRLRLLLPLLFRREALPELRQRLEAEDRAGTVEAVAALLLRPLRRWPTTGLWRALAVYSVLRASGADVRLHLGVRRRGVRPGDHRAHAWVVRDGRPFFGTPPPNHFAFVFAWPADAGPLLAARERATSGLRPSLDVVLTELRDLSGILLDPVAGRHLTLNASGVVAWKLLASGASSAEELVRGLGDQFPEIDPADLRRRVLALVAALREDGLVLEGGAERRIPCTPPPAG